MPRQKRDHSLLSVDCRLETLRGTGNLLSTGNGWKPMRVGTRDIGLPSIQGGYQRFGVCWKLRGRTTAWRFSMDAASCYPYRMEEGHGRSCLLVRAAKKELLGFSAVKRWSLRCARLHTVEPRTWTLFPGSCRAPALPWLLDASSYVWYISCAPPGTFLLLEEEEDSILFFSMSKLE